MINKLLRGRNYKDMQKQIRRLKVPISAVGAYLGNGSNTKTKTKKRKASQTVQVSVGKRRKAKKRIVPYQNKLKGVSKNLKTKILKVIEHSDQYGEYRYGSDAQLRQQVRDEWFYAVQDNNAIPFNYFTPRQFWDAAAVCFNQKAMAAGGEDVQLNSYVPATKMKVISSGVNFHFKSTSCHVVFLEMYICTPIKDMNPSLDVYNALLWSTDDYYNNNDQTIPQKPSFNIASQPSFLREYKVEVKKFRIQPGDYASAYLAGPSNCVLDGSTLLQNDTTANTTVVAGFNKYMKQTKSVFFRILNEISVSTTTQVIGAFPSSAIGGIACRIERFYRMADPKMATGNQHGKNAYCTGAFYLTEGGDQQVVFQNPSNVAVGTQ